MSGASPCLIFAATLLLLSTITSSAASRMAKPGCRETCGNLTIPYPFGIGRGCYHSRRFDVSCENNHTFKHNSSSLMEIYNISLLGGQVRASTFIASKCSNTNGTATDWDVWTHTSSFTISSKANKFTAIGCNTLALLSGNNSHQVGTGCLSMCRDTQSVDPSSQCSGMGCCQTSIVANLTFIDITFDDRYNNSVVNDFNPCSYAFVAEQDWFKFEPSYLEGNKFKGSVPTVFDWVAGKESCEEAIKNSTSYAWKMGAKISTSVNTQISIRAMESAGTLLGITLVPARLELTAQTPRKKPCKVLLECEGGRSSNNDRSG